MVNLAQPPSRLCLTGGLLGELECIQGTQPYQHSLRRGVNEPGAVMTINKLVQDRK
jgi:hypothetical protein